MFKNYIKIAWRNLIKNKGFTFINIIGLAIGMASAALILFWVTNELSFDRTYQKADRLTIAYNLEKFDGKIHIWNITPKVLGTTLKNGYSAIEDVARVNPSVFLFSAGDKQIYERGYFSDPGFLTMFTFPLLKGDVNTALNGPYSIVITQGFAKKMFGTEDVIGKTLRVDSNANFIVSAVMKDLPNNTSLKFSYILPWAYLKHLNGDDTYWGNNSVYTYVLLKKDISIKTANQQIKDVTKSHSDRKDNQNFLYPVGQTYLYGEFDNGKISGGRISTVRLFMFIAFFILLVACINFMNLSTARSEKRAKEVGIRKVAGAKRGMLISQFLAESVMVSVIAGIIALCLIYSILPAFNQISNKQLYIPFTSVTFWLVSLSFILLTGLVAGSYPAFYLSSFKPIAILKGSIQKVNALITPRKILVVIQFTFAITLIICTIIVKNQLDYAQNRRLGYNRNNLVYTQMAGNMEKKYSSLRNALLETGAVTGVSKTGSPITEGWSNSYGYEWKGSAPNNRIVFDVLNTAGDFVKTMGLKLLDGRDIDPIAYPTDSVAMLINKSAAKTMNLKNPVGETVKGQGHTWHIVGVIDDFILRSPYEPVEPMILMSPKSWFNVIHYRLNPQHSTADNLKKVAAVFKEFNPDYPFDYKFADEEYAKKFDDEKRIGTLATLFAALTVIISCLGLFGLATYMAQNRIKEIGVRKVLGASVGSITTLLSTDFIKLVLVSFAVAVPVAWWGMYQWLQKYPYRTDISIWVFIIAGITTVAIALLTVSYQSVKAAIANPVKSLRSE